MTKTAVARAETTEQTHDMAAMLTQAAEAVAGGIEICIGWGLICIKYER